MLCGVIPEGIFYLLGNHTVGWQTKGTPIGTPINAHHNCQQMQEIISLVPLRDRITILQWGITHEQVSNDLRTTFTNHSSIAGGLARLPSTQPCWAVIPLALIVWTSFRMGWMLRGCMKGRGSCSLVCLSSASRIWPRGFALWCCTSRRFCKVFRWKALTITIIVHTNTLCDCVQT